MNTSNRELQARALEVLRERPGLVTEVSQLVLDMHTALNPGSVPVTLGDIRDVLQSWTDAGISVASIKYALDRVEPKELAE